MKIICIFCFSILLWSCQTNELRQVGGDVKLMQTEVGLTESFDTFYKKFYQDSSFQVTRIRLPLLGVKKYWDQDIDTLIKIEPWIDESMPVISNQETLRKYYDNIQRELINTDSVITEKYWVADSGFLIERKYKLYQGQWFLVYYDLFNL